MGNHALPGLLLALLLSSLPTLDAVCTTGYKYDATKTRLSSGSPIGRLACNVCAAGYGAQLYSTLSGWHYGDCSEPQRADTRLYCAACQAGSYSTGGWCACRACQAAGGPCNQPPTCKAFKSCDKTTGKCTWCNAADNTPCTNSAGAAGTCKYGSCQVAPNVNACLTYTCKSTGPGGASTCTDLPNPAPNSAAGRVCGCQLSTSTYKDDATGCVDIDACKPSNWPCKQDGKGGAADCLDILKAPNSTAGRKCTCKLSTSIYANETSGCVDIDACQWWRCQQGGTGGLALCSDLGKAANSTAGRTCSCQLSTSVYANDTAGCVDVNACRWWRCKQDGPGGGADCMDILQAPNSTVGRTCSCKLQFSVYQNETAGCVDIDACIGWPCNQGGLGGGALCTDKTAAANSTEGRTCSCDNGATYAEATGCPSLGTLTLSRDRIPVGSSGDLVTFTAKFASNTTGQVVELHNADSQGTPTSLLSTMVDDGSYAARDAAANDGLFTYTMKTADCAAAGDRHFAALIKDQTPPRELLTATLHCFTPATTEQVSQSMTHASEVYNQLQQMVTSQGSTVPAALASMATTLRTDAAVDQASVQTTGAAVTWRSLEGLKFRAYLPLPGQRARPVNASHTALVNRVQRGVLRPVSEGTRASELPVSGLMPARGGSRGANASKTHLPRPLGVPDLEATTTVKAASASDTCSISKGKVLLVSPYTNEFTAQGGDESLTIATNFAAAGYTVEYFCQPPAGSPGTCKDVKDFLRLETFRDWGRYAAVVLVTHGDASDDGSDAVVDTGVKYDSITGGELELATKAWMQNDLEVLAGPAGGVIGLKPGWFKQADLLPLCGTVVYFGACRSARSTTAGSFARVFTDQGAASFVGYTDYVASSFSTPRGLSTFTHLLADGTVGTYPASGDVETDSNPATFVGYHVDANRRLPAMCNSLAATDLLIEYSWPPALQNIALRTATTFNGIQPVTTGLECAVYTNSIEWSNSDAFSTGKETVKILLSQARSDGAFTDRVKIALRAGWTAPNTPDLLAVATVWLVDRATGAKVGGQAMAIHPKQWPATGCADAPAVGYVVVEVQGGAGSEKVMFFLSYSDPDASSTPSGGQCPALLALGYNHGCVALEDKRIKCWGSNHAGQLGSVSWGSLFSPVPVAVVGLNDVSIYHQSLALGNGHTCALLTNKTVACWGSNMDGMLGQGDTNVEYSYVPLLVKGLADVDSVAAGLKHTCAVLRDHTVKCWGSNQYYTLGLGEVVEPAGPQVTYSATPQPVAGLTDVQAVSVGGFHSCALLISGQVYCWGNTQHGQMGTGYPVYTIAASAPVKAGIAKAAVEVSCGDMHTCACLEDNTVACWGNNQFSATGQPSSVNPVGSPTAVAGLQNVLHVSTGYYHSCVVLADHTARCWGHNTAGQLGDGASGVYAQPTPVTVALEGIESIQGGGYHTCALLSNASIACWGDNNEGQVGIGSTSDPILTPISVTHLPCSRDDSLECRSVTKAGGVPMHQNPCAAGAAIITVPQGSLVSYKTEAGHMPSECSTTDKQCYIRVSVDLSGLTWNGWIPSGLPDQPQSLPCGVAPGQAYVSCCQGQTCTGGCRFAPSCSSPGSCYNGATCSDTYGGACRYTAKAPGSPCTVNTGDGQELQGMCGTGGVCLCAGTCPIESLGLGPTCNLCDAETGCLYCTAARPRRLLADSCTTAPTVLVGDTEYQAELRPDGRLYIKGSDFTSGIGASCSRDGDLYECYAGGLQRWLTTAEYDPDAYVPLRQLAHAFAYQPKGYRQGGFLDETLSWWRAYPQGVQGPVTIKASVWDPDTAAAANTHVIRSIVRETYSDRLGTQTMEYQLVTIRTWVCWANAANGAQNAVLYDNAKQQFIKGLKAWQTYDASDAASGVNDADYGRWHQTAYVIDNGPPVKVKVEVIEVSTCGEGVLEVEIVIDNASPPVKASRDDRQALADKMGDGGFYNLRYNCLLGTSDWSVTSGAYVLMLDAKNLKTGQPAVVWNNYRFAAAHEFGHRLGLFEYCGGCDLLGGVNYGPPCPASSISVDGYMIPGCAESIMNIVETGRLGNPPGVATGSPGHVTSCDIAVVLKAFLQNTMQKMYEYN